MPMPVRAVPALHAAQVSRRFRSFETLHKQLRSLPTYRHVHQLALC